MPEIARYILDNEEGWLFGSITASYKVAGDLIGFVPVSEDNPDIGYLEVDPSVVNFIINDGQHRAAAIKEALPQNDGLRDESISILLFPYEKLSRVQQMFTDLNKNVVKPSKSLNILFDHRDPIAEAVRLGVENVSAFQGLVDKDAQSLPVKSPFLFTLTSIYDASVELLSYHGNDNLGHREAANEIIEFWNAVADVIPEWEKVKQKKINSQELRTDKICAHSVVLRAIGGIGGELKSTLPKGDNGWKAALAGLRNIDWRKSNPEWDSVCIVANSVVSNRQARVATKAFIKRKLKLKLTDVETAMLGDGPAAN